MKNLYYKIKNYPQIQRILQNKYFKKYEKWALLAIWAGAIYFLSSQPLGFIAVADYWQVIIRKLAHMLEFGVLTFLIFRILKCTEKKHIYWNLFWAGIFSFLYSVSDEYHQSFVPGRVGTYKDVLIDFAGIIIALWLIYLHYHHEKVRKLKYQKQKENPIK